MRLAILSRNKSLHSMRRLVSEARALKVHCEILDPLECQLVVEGGRKGKIYHGPRIVGAFDAVLPRIGASVTSYGLAVVKQFEALGVFSINSSEAIAQSRDKMWCLQVLSMAGLQVPATILTRQVSDLRATIDAIRGFPAVLKVLQGTQGVGVMLLHTPIALKSVLETLWTMEQEVLIQQFIAEGQGRDFRAFVIGDRVVAAMMRTAIDGDFRANIHRGGAGNLIHLSKPYESAAVRAAKAVGLEIAGVDLIESNSGPMVLEVNSSPGFEGIEKATGLNIARQIMQHIKKKVAERYKRSATRRKKR